MTLSSVYAHCHMMTGRSLVKLQTGSFLLGERDDVLFEKNLLATAIFDGLHKQQWPEAKHKNIDLT